MEQRIIHTLVLVCMWLYGLIAKGVERASVARRISHEAEGAVASEFSGRRVLIRGLLCSRLGLGRGGRRACLAKEDVEVIEGRAGTATARMGQGKSQQHRVEGHERRRTSDL